MKHSSVNLTEGVIWKALIQFSIPLLLSALLQQLYNTADLMIVGRFAGKIAMASVGATSSISSLIIALFLGLSTGASVMVAQFFGANDRERLNATIETTYGIAIFGGLALTIFTYFMAPIFLRAMDTPKEVFEGAVTYLRIIFIGIIPMMIYNMGSGILRSVGDSQRPFNFLFVSAIINIILDLLFVVVFKWGVAGAGWATVIAQCVAAILVTYSLRQGSDIYRLDLRSIGIKKAALIRIFEIGLPAGLQSTVISFSNVLIQSKINGFGADAVAGVAACERVDGFVFLALQAFAIASTTFTGQNIGAGKVDRLKKGTKTSIILVVTVAISVGLVVVIFAKPLLGLFSKNEEVINYGAKMVYVLAPTYWIFGMSEVLGGIIRGAGKAIPPMIISIISMCGLRMVWIYTALPKWKVIEVVYFSYPISWIITFAIMLAYFLKGHWIPELPTVKE